MRRGGWQSFTSNTLVRLTLQSGLWFCKRWTHTHTQIETKKKEREGVSYGRFLRQNYDGTLLLNRLVVTHTHTHTFLSSFSFAISMFSRTCLKPWHCTLLININSFSVPVSCRKILNKRSGVKVNLRNLNLHSQVSPDNAFLVFAAIWWQSSV